MALSFDRPETWADPAIHHAPSFDVDTFQQKIDDIFGLSDTGMPIVRLVWAGDIKKTYSKRYTAWIGNQGTGFEMRARYKYSTVQIPGTPDIIDIPPPRWVLEEYQHPGQAGASYEAARWDKDGRELFPPLPTENSYAPLLTIAKHNERKCCKFAKRDKVVCWGKFRHPAQVDLDILKRAKAKRDADYHIDPTKPLTERDQNRIALETKKRIEEQEAITQQRIKEFVDENALELLEIVTGRKFSEKTKKFSIPKFTNTTKTEAGIYVPSNN